MDYAEFDTARRRIIRAWGNEITDADELATAVDELREQVPGIPRQVDRSKALRHLDNLNDLVAEARTPESETLRQATQALAEASRTDGTAAELRARAEAGIEQITRIAEAAPTVAESDAALELNGTLAETLAVLDEADDPGSQGPAVDAKIARFVNDPAIPAPTRGGAASSQTRGTDPAVPGQTRGSGPAAPGGPAIPGPARGEPADRAIAHRATPPKNPGRDL